MKINKKIKNLIMTELENDNRNQAQTINTLVKILNDLISEKKLDNDQIKFYEEKIKILEKEQ